jgi:hypothetical protein
MIDDGLSIGLTEPCQACLIIKLQNPPTISTFLPFGFCTALEFELPPFICCLIASKFLFVKGNYSAYTNQVTISAQGGIVREPR